MSDAIVREVFRFINRYFMAPAFRLGLGPLISNPFSGYIMILKTIGRKSGKTCCTPVNYAIWHGNVYCMAGFGEMSDWFRNLSSNPAVELILPGGALFGNAHRLDDRVIHLSISRQILKNGGFAGFFMGFNPRTAPDSLVEERMKDIPLVCIQPEGLGSGSADPGEWGWVSSNLGLLFAIVALILLLQK